jgi:hypothetical protein
MPNTREELLFSAHSLQSYVDCARRFELNYLEELKWPAVESEPLLESERHMTDGRRFHEMVHRDTLGISVASPSAEGDEDLARWWGNYQTHQPAQGEGDVRFAEKTLVGSVNGRTLMATCDLVVIDGDVNEGGAEGDRCKARIYDWKTWRRRHSREWLQGRLQTRIYPYLLVQSGAALTEGAAEIRPQDVEMVYWYSEFPENGGEVFAYSEAQYREDESYLNSLIDEIMVREAGSFELTSNEKQCTYCVYRSFCDRGEVAGDFGESEGEGQDAGEEASPLLANLDDYESIAF